MKNLSQLIKLVQLTILILLVAAGLVLRWYTWRDQGGKAEAVYEVRTKTRKMR